MSASVIIEHRIPARMRELDAFIKLAGKLDGASKVTLTIDSDTFEISDFRFLLHPLADSAALVARALLHFLGIGYDAKKAMLTTVKVHSDDLKMADLNLAAVSPVQATSGWTITPSRAADLLKLCFVTGNKVSAHLTEQSAATTNASIANLRESCELVSALINREVFQALGQDHVTFELGGAHGSITERPQ